MSNVNASALFYRPNSSESLHGAIQLPQEAKQELARADKDLRKAIRSEVSGVVRSGRQMELATSAFRATRTGPPLLDVRFLLQGGMAYDTAIEPAQMPPQQCDRDTGVYVKTSFLRHQEPGLASKGLFDLVEAAIRRYCSARGWVIKPKKTCVRVETDKNMHIDLPLYAIPDDDFNTLERSINDATGMNMETASGQLLSLMRENRTLRIPSDRIMLAHREEGWVPSDPRSLHDWFEEQFKQFGPQVRRQIRYFKGWRDFTFEKGGPSSIALMACVIDCYRNGNVTEDESRDDMAFHQISKELPELMRIEIKNPVLPNSNLLNDWDESKRARYQNAAQNLHEIIDKAMSGHDKIMVTRNIQKCLGDRVPDNPNLVELDSRPSAITPLVISSSALPGTNRTTSG